MAMYLIMAKTKNGAEDVVSELLFSREEAEECLEKMVLPEGYQYAWIYEPPTNYSW